MSISAGKSFSASAPLASAANASVGVAIAWNAGERRSLRGAHDVAVAMRHHDESPAGARDVVHLSGARDGARSDEDVVAEAFAQPPDALERIG